MVLCFHSPVYGQVAEPGTEKVLVRTVFQKPALQGIVAQLFIDLESFLIILHAGVNTSKLQTAFVPGGIPVVVVIVVSGQTEMVENQGVVQRMNLLMGALRAQLRSRTIFLTFEYMSAMASWCLAGIPNFPSSRYCSADCK